ncbi:hypothetical protein [Cupriavidus campinensis]|nr:hypothetical protein [Cupriavidus campinensis]
MGIEISFRAETKVPDTVEQGDLPILDLDGVWRPKAFYRMPLQTRQMVLSTHYIDVIESEDEADHQNLMAYPYPFRMERLNPVRELIGHFRKDVAAKIRELAEVPGLGYQEFCEVICRDLPPFILVTHASPRTADPINVPVYFFEALHFLKCNGRVFYARDGLVERLQMTVMERDMPLSQIRSPFPDIYIHLESSIRYATVEGDPVTLNGFFVSEMVSAETERRRLTICPIVTEGTDVITSLLDAFEVDVDDGVERKLYDALATFFQLSVEEVDSDVRAHAIGLATKILFYVDVKSARIVPHNANDSRSLAFLQAKARKATKPGARTSRPLRAYDFIEIGPEDSIRLEQERAERKVGHSLHWRRGHNRMQAHGPHHSLHHKIWIMPQLINKELLGDEAPPPPPKDYDLR